ncbi:MAG: GTP-binding protein [Alphaproteobacteria bacterium]|jgi:G3E family GTPase
MTEGAQMRRLAAEWDFVLSTLAAPGEDGELAAGSVGVTILAGFLGAGKTTALGHLLQGDHGLRLMAVVNDLGAVNIDAALIERSSDDVIQLTNGCGCCALGGELGRVVEELGAASPPPDGIIVEASGIADPGAMATAIAAGTNARLDGIVTLVDAQAADTWLENPATRPLFQRQLDAAHVLVLNKTDLVGENQQKALTARLGELAPGRPIIPTSHGRLDSRIVLGAALRGARADPGNRPHEDAIFETRAIPLADAVERRDLVAFLEAPATGLLRLKGFVHLAGEGGEVLHIVQAVGRMWRIDPLPGDGASDPPWRGLILIGLAAQVEDWGGDDIAAHHFTY